MNMGLSLPFFCISKRCDDRLGNTQLTLPFPWGTLTHGRACDLWLGEARGRLLPKNRGSCQVEQWKEDAEILHRRSSYLKQSLSDPKRV